MYPMDFEEFLWAIGNKATPKLLAEIAAKKMPLGDAAHRKIMRIFRLYMLIGGMPQAVNEYLRTNNFRLVDAVKRDILQLYEDDFRKIDSSGKMTLLFNAVPAQLNTNSSRYNVSSVLEGDRTAQILTAKGHALYYHTFLNEKRSIIMK